VNGLGVFGVIDRCGAIVHAAEDLGVVCTWNGSLTFHMWIPGGAEWTAVEAWTVEDVPRSLDEAVRICERRADEMRKEMAS
jgi:hypothetical protein